MHRDPHLVQLIENAPQRVNRPLQHRSVRHVEHVALRLQRLAGFLRLRASGIREVDVRPAGEPVFLVPGAFAVAHQHQFLHCRKAFLPANFALSPRRSSMRSNWLYLAMRSVRLAEPVLIWPAFVATTRSAMNGSSVSPERCDTTAVYPAFAAVCIASSVSVSVPIWFTFTRIELPTPASMPRFSRSVFVT